ncbi:phosphohydrolase, partial [Vibrio splendidus]
SKGSRALWKELEVQLEGAADKGLLK